MVPMTIGPKPLLETRSLILFYIKRKALVCGKYAYDITRRFGQDHWEFIM